MKIAEVVCVFPPYKGGIGKTALEQARGLAEKGGEVEVFTPDFGRGKIAGEKFKTNYLKPVVKFGNSAFLPQLLWRLKSFDAVIFHYPFFGTMEVLWLAKKLGLWRGKFFVYYHMDFLPTSLFLKVFSWPSRLILKSFLKMAEKIIVQSIDYTENSVLKDFYLVNKDKFVEIAPGTTINSQQLTANSDNENFILFVGGMDRPHYFKGVEVLLRAFNKLVSECQSVQCQSVKLFLVGDGDLRPQYEKLAQELGLGGKVKFLGKVNDEEKEQLYRDCEFFVLPSINSGEAFGLVLTEAMVFGKAVLATNLPGVRTVCRDGINGLLAAPGDENDLAEKMKTLLENEELRKKFGEAGRKLVEEKFNWEKHVDELMKIIK